MRRRWLALCLVGIALLCQAGPAGLAEDSLPEEALRLFDTPQWAGYDIADVSGYGGNASFAAQYAVLLCRAGHNVLCILEKPPEADAFAITLQTDRAVYQGDKLPSLLIDTGGDALFYTYRGTAAGEVAMEMLSSAKTDGVWGPVNYLRQWTEADGALYEVEVFATEAGFARRTYRFDANENMLSHTEAEPLGDPGMDAPLAAFDLEQLTAWLRALDAQG